MSPASRLTAWGVLAFSLLLTSRPASAAENIKVSVLVIVASEKDDTTDPRLKCVADEVRKVNPRLKSFRVEKLACESIPMNAKKTFQLINDQTATITVEPGAKKGDRVQVRISPPLLGEIAYTTPCGKFLPIITRYRPRKHELLIIAIRVQPCTGKQSDK